MGTAEPSFLNAVLNIGQMAVAFSVFGLFCGLGWFLADAAARACGFVTDDEKA